MERIVAAGNRAVTAFVQRRMGDGHLSAPQLAGDTGLEDAFDGERLFRRGATGESVRELQEALIGTGYPLPSTGASPIRS